MPSPLSLALDSLCNTLGRGTYSNLQLKNALNDSALDVKDRALYKQLYFGVLERLYTLDFYIGRFSKNRPESMKPQLLNILRLGCYRIIYLDTYDSIAVNEAVELAKKYAPYASGFVNGLLRNISRNKETLINENMPPFVKYSVSESIYSLMRSSYGKEKTNAFLEGCFEKGEIALRVNTLRTDAESLKKRLLSEGIDAEGEGNSLIVRAHASIENTPSYKEGLYHLQGPASQRAVELLGIEPGMTVIDACAAPGSKSFTAAYIMENKGGILAFDLHEHRVDLIKAGAKRLGLTIMEAKAADASLPFEGEADRIICDMPCSGLGMLAKRPEIRYKDMSKIKELTEIQTAILNNMAPHLKKGGRLLYSTCTVNPDENEHITDAFLEAHSDYYYVEFPETSLAYGKEGFFTAVIGRKDD